jgi:hypothetical protein
MTFVAFGLIYVILCEGRFRGDVSQRIMQGWNSVVRETFAANYALGACIGHALPEGLSSIGLLLGVLGVRGSLSHDIPRAIVRRIGEQRWQSMLGKNYAAAWLALMASAVLLGALSLRLSTGAAALARLLGLRAFAGMLIECTVNEGVPDVWFWMYRRLFRAGEMGWMRAGAERLTLCLMLAAVVTDSFRICLFDVVERCLWGMRDFARRAFSDLASRA